MPFKGYGGTQRQVVSPVRCRKVAAERFSFARAAQGYLDLYARILDGERLP